MFTCLQTAQAWHPAIKIEIEIEIEIGIGIGIEIDCDTDFDSDTQSTSQLAETIQSPQCGQRWANSLMSKPQLGQGTRPARSSSIRSASVSSGPSSSSSCQSVSWSSMVYLGFISDCGFRIVSRTSPNPKSEIQNPKLLGISCTVRR